MGVVDINKNNNKKYLIFISLMSALCLTTPNIKLEQVGPNNDMSDNNIMFVKNFDSLDQLQEKYDNHQSITPNNSISLNNLNNMNVLTSFNTLNTLTPNTHLNEWQVDFSLQDSANASALDENKTIASNNANINFTKNSNLSLSKNSNDATNTNNTAQKISLIDINNEDKNSAAATIAENLSYKTSLSDIYKLDKNKEKINKLTNYISINYKVPETEAKEIVSSTYQQSIEKGVDPLLVLSLIEVESAFNKNVRSKYGAVGLTQVMPKSHPEEVAQSKNISKNISDVKANIFVGVNVLKKYLMLQKGNVVLALQAYNGSLKDKKTKYYKKIEAKRENLVQVASS
jgi:soluble lytic murein transglycosylase-like protein